MVFIFGFTYLKLSMCEDDTISLVQKTDCRETTITTESNLSGIEKRCRNARWCKDFKNYLVAFPNRRLSIRCNKIKTCSTSNIFRNDLHVTNLFSAFDSQCQFYGLLNKFNQYCTVAKKVIWGFRQKIDTDIRLAIGYGGVLIKYPSLPIDKRKMLQWQFVSHSLYCGTRQQSQKLICIFLAVGKSKHTKAILSFVSNSFLRMI